MLVGASAVVAHAATTVYHDRGTFLAATGAVSATGPLPDDGVEPGDMVTVGTVHFSLTAPSYHLFLGLGGSCGTIPNCDWTLRNPGPDIAISDIENLNADFLAGPVVAAGFDFVKPINDYSAVSNPGLSTFEITLLLGGVAVDSFRFDTPSADFPADSLDFVGVADTVPFDRMEIREVVGGIDDEFWGQFYTAGNRPPDCSGATATPSTLWPPNHKFVPVKVTGVTDSDGDAVSVRVTSIFQDEPVLQTGTGSGKTCPDGSGIGSNTALLRAERDGTEGDGRVYRVSFTATDSAGLTCDGQVAVCVPHDLGHGGSCTDNGTTFNSTVCQ